MNLHEQEGKRIDFTAKRSSTSSYITAWQIESTLTNMEQFIKLIQQCEAQKLNIQSILPQISRIKKIDQEKQSLRKQLKDLSKLNITLHNAQKQQIPSKSQNEQENIVFLHENRLKKVVKNLKDQSKRIQKQITLSWNTLQKEKINRHNEQEQKKINFLSQLNLSLSNQEQFVTQKILERQNQLNIKTFQSIYEPFIEQYINKRILLQTNNSSKFKNSDSEYSHRNKSSVIADQFPEVIKKINLNKNSIESFEKIVDHIQIQLEETKCKLLSLQDKKRKITVKNLLKNKKQQNKQGYGCNFQPSLSSKSIGITKQPSKIPNQSEKIINKTEGNFFTSLFSMFTNPSQQQQQIPHQKQNNPVNYQTSQTKLSRSSHDQISQQDFQFSLEDIEDKQTKLRMIELNSQILELRQHMNIMVNQNIFDQIVACVMKLKQINEELHPLLDQLFQVVSMFSNQSFSQQLHMMKLKQNENLRFFMNIIKSKFMLRAQIIKKLFFSIRYSISVAIKYMKKRYLEIKSQYEQFLEENFNKDKKIKATQALKSRTQVFIMNSTLESLALEIDSVIEDKLLKFQELFHTQLHIFKKHAQKMTQSKIQKNVNQVNQNSIQRTQFSHFKQRQIYALQKMLLNPQEQNNKFQNSKQIVRRQHVNNIKQQIQYQFFNFYEELIMKTHNIFNIN